MNDRLAVIILNYFGHSDTKACAASVVRCMDDPGLFVVDNSANAGEAAELRRLFSDEPEAHLIFSERNLGFAAGANRGLEQACAAGFSRFLLLNNDAVLLEGSGKILQDACISNPGALIAPSIRWDGSMCAGNYYHRYIGMIRRNKPRRTGGWLFYLTGCALLFDRQFLEKNGFFNEAFFMYGEDVEFSARAYARGAQVLCLPEIIVEHAGSGSARMASFFYEYHIVRSHFLLTFFLLRHPLQRLLSLGAKAAFLLARAVYRSFRFKTAAPLKALCLAPFALPVRPS